MNLQSLLLHARNQNIRAVVALEGDTSWLLTAYSSLREALSSWFERSASQQVLILSPNEDLAIFTDHDLLVEPSKFKASLGRETEILVWDLLDEVRPDALAATSGTLVGGGILITLAKKEERKLASERRWYGMLCESDTSLVLAQDNFQTELSLLQSKNQVDAFIASEKITKTTALQLNQEQQDCVELIEHVVSGHRHRPLILRADRGRGKSTLLGVAAAQLINQNNADTIVLATNQSVSIKVLETHFKEHLDDRAQEHRLKIMPYDAILNENPVCTLLLIDEAASLPLPVLEALLGKFPRVVMASTLHGYEGSGRGFDLKLQQILERCNQQGKVVALNTPVRWAAHCSLEQTINHAFILKTSFPELEKLSELDEPVLHWLRPEALESDDKVLEELFSLLVLAHYQTRPSDLALLMDNPALHIALLKSSGRVIGAALCIDEHIPEASDAHLAEDIICGKRRLMGRLLPQALATYFGDKQWLQHRTLRVMRIVVHPHQQNKGFGSLLLKEIEQYAMSNKFDACSVSFGVDERLVSFWQGAGYRCMRLSYKADASSGVRSSMLVKPLCKTLTDLCDHYQPYFHRHLVSGLNLFYQDLQPELLTALLQGSNQQLLNSLHILDQDAHRKLSRLATSRSAIWDCWPELQSLVLQACVKSNKALQTQLNKLIAYILLGDSSVVAKAGGKKAWERELREAVGKLLADK
jgi:tRNA(Met) cytidine acetyltransferase